jgi:uncharacterized damage-inducible protein DinB
MATRLLPPQTRQRSQSWQSEMNTNPEIARIVRQMELAFDGEAWHGPALMELLSDVSAETAAARPIASAHTIWELTLHVAAWEEVIRRRLGGEALTLSDEENFPRVPDVSDASWNKAVQALVANHKALLAGASALPDERLGDRVPGKDYDVYTMLHGSAQHVIYHAGQIVLLMRAVGQ